MFPAPERTLRPGDPVRLDRHGAPWGHLVLQGGREIGPGPARGAWSKAPRMRRALVATDLAVALPVVALADSLWLPVLCVGLLQVVLIRNEGLQRPRLTPSLLDDSPTLVMCAAGSTAVVAMAAAATGTSLLHERFLRLALALLVLLLTARWLAYSVVRLARRRRLISHPTLILGCGRIGGRLARDLLDHPEYGLRPVGFLDSAPLLPESERPVPLLAATSALPSVVALTQPDAVVLAFSSDSEGEMVDVLRACDRLDIEVFVVPRLYEMHSTHRLGESVRGIPLTRVRRPAFQSVSWHAKRVLDVTAASVLLLLAAPVMTLCALGSRLETGPGVIFRQERVGIDGRRFELYKFRSLRPASQAESATTWSVAHDTRLGPVGRFLRRTSLDELPQLFNVLRGDMSLVGPRPERPHFVEEFSLSVPRYPARHRVPCGLTGWAQISGLRGNTSIEDRAQFDNYYIENWSLWLDITILVRTVAQVALGRGA